MMEADSRPLEKRRRRLAATLSLTAARTTMKQLQLNHQPSTSVTRQTVNVGMTGVGDPLVIRADDSDKLNQMERILRTLGRRSRPRRARKLSNAAQLKQTQQGVIDLHTPDSILTRVQIRSLLTRSTFCRLPSLYQLQLARMLPESDGHTANDGLMKLGSASLSNELLARGCLHWQQRLSKGEFTHDNQNKHRAELESRKRRLDPWKARNFEPVWGRRRVRRCGSPVTSAALSALSAPLPPSADVAAVRPVGRVKRSWVSVSLYKSPASLQPHRTPALPHDGGEDCSSPSARRRPCTPYDERGSSPSELNSSAVDDWTGSRHDVSTESTDSVVIESVLDDMTLMSSDDTITTISITTPPSPAGSEDLPLVRLTSSSRPPISSALQDDTEDIPLVRLTSVRCAVSPAAQKDTEDFSLVHLSAKRRTPDFEEEYDEYIVGDDEEREMGMPEFLPHYSSHLANSSPISSVPDSSPVPICSESGSESPHPYVPSSAVPDSDVLPQRHAPTSAVPGSGVSPHHEPSSPSTGSCVSPQQQEPTSAFHGPGVSPQRRTPTSAAPDSGVSPPHHEPSSPSTGSCVSPHHHEPSSPSTGSDVSPHHHEPYSPSTGSGVSTQQHEPSSPSTGSCVSPHHHEPSSPSTGSGVSPPHHEPSSPSTVSCVSPQQHESINTTAVVSLPTLTADGTEVAADSSVGRCSSRCSSTDGQNDMLEPTYPPTVVKKSSYPAADAAKLSPRPATGHGMEDESHQSVTEDSLSPVVRCVSLSASADPIECSYAVSAVNQSHSPAADALDESVISSPLETAIYECSSPAVAMEESLSPVALDESVVSSPATGVDESLVSSSESGDMSVSLLEGQCSTPRYPALLQSALSPPTQQQFLGNASPQLPQQSPAQLPSYTAVTTPTVSVCPPVRQAAVPCQPFTDPSASQPTSAAPAISTRFTDSPQVLAATPFTESSTAAVNTQFTGSPSAAVNTQFTGSPTAVNTQFTGSPTAVNTQLTGSPSAAVNTQFTGSPSAAVNTQLTGSPSAAVNTQFTGSPSAAVNTQFTGSPSAAVNTQFTGSPSAAVNTQFTGSPSAAVNTQFTGSPSATVNTQFTGSPSAAVNTQLTGSPSATVNTQFTVSPSAAVNTQFTVSPSAAVNTQFTGSPSAAASTQFTGSPPAPVTTLAVTARQRQSSVLPTVNTNAPSPVFSTNASPSPQLVSGPYSAVAGGVMLQHQLQTSVASASLVLSSTAAQSTRLVNRSKPRSQVGRMRNTRPPAGSVNLERSYQICQAVIAKSQNRAQLQAQMRPLPRLLADNRSRPGTPPLRRISTAAPSPATTPPLTAAHTPVAPPLTAAHIQISPPLTAAHIQISPPLTAAHIQISPSVTAAHIHTTPPLTAAHIQAATSALTTPHRHTTPPLTAVQRLVAPSFTAVQRHTAPHLTAVQRHTAPHLTAVQRHTAPHLTAVQRHTAPHLTAVQRHTAPHLTAAQRYTAPPLTAAQRLVAPSFTASQRHTAPHLTAAQRYTSGHLTAAHRHAVPPMPASGAPSAMQVKYLQVPGQKMLTTARVVNLPPAAASMGLCEQTGGVVLGEVAENGTLLLRKDLLLRGRQKVYQMRDSSGKTVLVMRPAAPVAAAADPETTDAGAARACSSAPPERCSSLPVSARPSSTGDPPHQYSRQPVVQQPSRYVSRNQQVLHIQNSPNPTAHCDCGLKPLVVCHQCGAYCHDDCVYSPADTSQRRVCSSCLTCR